MKYLSLFSGIGGFEKGIQQAYEDLSKTERFQQGRLPRHSSKPIKQFVATKQPTCIGYSEIDKYAIQVYNKQFNHKNYGDITKINEKELPDFDFLVCGFPCQSFSIAGKRGGFEDTRGTLFFEIARIIKQKQPRILLLENVKGLLSHDQGNTFTTIISTLDELGYDVQWQILNSKNFGVPQNRERVFIVGHLRGTRRPEVFPIGEDDEVFSKTDGANKTQSQAKLASTIRTKEGTRADDNFIKVAGTLEGGGWEKRNESTRRVYDTNGISPTVPTCGGGGVHPKIIDKKGKPKNKNYASTLTGGGHSGGNHSDMDLLLEGAKIRRLTPKECERLQGFPDDWTKQGIDGKKNGFDVITELSDTQRYKQCGNAVTTCVVKAIMLRLLYNN